MGILNQLSFLALLGISATSSAATKLSKEQLLYAEIDQSVKNYQQAQVLYDDGDEKSLLVMNKALEDLEDVANRCFKLKTCSKTNVITAYEKLVKKHDIANIAIINPNPAMAAMPALGETLKLLGGRNFEFLIQNNEPLQAAIGTWLSTQRGFFLDSWENYQYMRYLMAPEYEKAGLPEALLFGMMTKESGGKVHSVSKAGAAGPLQFMPGTGRRFGLDSSVGADMRYDPQYAARANAAYMNERFAELNRSLEMAIAGYNGGEGRARRIHNEYSGANFWNENVYKQWPAETRDYVPAVIAAAWLFLHGSEYGLTFPKIDPTPSQLVLSKSTTINELTICLGNPSNQATWYRVLRNLNPAYEPSQFIGQGTMLRAPKKLVDSYRVNCLTGPRADMARTLTQARKQPIFQSPQPFLAESGSLPEVAVEGSIATGSELKHDGKYIVKSGETLMMITRTFDCDLRRLIAQNDLSPPDYVIRPGQEIKLAGCKK
jgi:membrane-bound lytic murein transglycosylase D